MKRLYRIENYLLGTILQAVNDEQKNNGTTIHAATLKIPLEYT